MRYLFLGAAALAFIVSGGVAVSSSPPLNERISIALAIISAGFAISGGPALLAAAVCKSDR